MNLSVFNSDSYRNFIIKKIEENSRNTKGIRSSLAKYLGIQSSYLSRTLKGDANLNQEQIQKTALFFNLDKEESRCLLILLLRDRAGSTELKEMLNEMLRELKEKNLEIKNKFKRIDTLHESIQKTYYSKWIYSALHVAVSIPSLRSIEQLAQHFLLKKKVVIEAMSFLEKSGLVMKSDQSYSMSKKSIHLSGDNPLSTSHHSNWRQQSLNALQSSEGKGQHYSSTFSLSHKDSIKIRHMIIEFLANTKKIIAPSREETIYHLGIDFFEL